MRLHNSSRCTDSFPVLPTLTVSIRPLGRRKPRRRTQKSGAVEVVSLYNKVIVCFKDNIFSRINQVRNASVFVCRQNVREVMATTDCGVQPQSRLRKQWKAEKMFRDKLLKHNRLRNLVEKMQKIVIKIFADVVFLPLLCTRFHLLSGVEQAKRFLKKF